MKLAELSMGVVRQALELYGELAYPGGTCDRIPSFEGEPTDSIKNSLHLFEDESPRYEGYSLRYVLRLGNEAYPFMKVVLEEHLLRGEFCLSVDTHDQMFRDLASDRSAMEEVRRHNRALKESIEAAWCAVDIPTLEHLEGIVRDGGPAPRPPRGQRILVVDDTRPAARTLCLLLERRGFETEWVEDGSEALDRADPGRHHLVLMDVEMPNVDGLEACRGLKADPDRAGLPVILASAGTFDLQLAHEADAFLTKPFQLEILFSFIDHLLPPPGGSA